MIPINHSILLPGKLSHEEVLPNRKVSSKCQILVNSCQAQAVCFNNIRYGNLLPIQRNRSLILLVDAHDNLDDSGFSRTIFPYQGMYLTGIDG